MAKIGWFDPFSGHGTSPLYAARHGVRYLGFDTNRRAFAEYLNIVNEECRYAVKPVEVRYADSTVFDPSLIGQFDLCYTSPPYFNFEEYGGNTGHFDDCETYDDFHRKITIPVLKNVYRYLVPGGMLVLQTEKDPGAKKCWTDVVSSLGYQLISSGVTGQEADKYSTMAKRDQTLLVFKFPEFKKEYYTCPNTPTV